VTLLEIIDSHTHWGPSLTLGTEVTTDEILRQAEQSGVQKIVIFPFPSTAPNPGLQGRVKSAVQYQPLPTGRQAERTPGAFPERSRRIRSGIVEGLIYFTIGEAP